MEKKKYYTVNKIYLANGLAYLGFNYYKFNNETGVIYSFEDTPFLRSAVKELEELRYKYNK